MHHPHNSVRRTSRLLILGAAAGLTASAIALPLQNSKPNTPPPTTAPEKSPEAAPVKKDLPAAKILIGRAVETLGGKKAFEGIKNVSYTMTVSSQGMDTPIKFRTGRTGRMLVDVDTPQGAASMGRVGDVVWANSPGMGYMLMPAEQSSQVTGMDLYGFILRLVDDNAGFETVDQSDFAGTDAFKVKMPRKGEPDSFGYFDTVKGTLLGIDQTQQTPMGDMTMTTTFMDYKETTPLNLFTKAEIGVSDQEMVLATMTFSEVQFNAVEESAFVLPEEVQKLVDAKNNPPATQPTGGGEGAGGAGGNTGGGGG